MPRRLVPIVLVAALVLAVASAVPRGQAAPRVVAIGDVHGSLTGFVSILKAAGLIDDNRKWIGGTTTLVQTGDLTDRGAEVRGVLDLMMALEREAPASRGTVVPLIGNHEVMNLLGDLRDATAEICASFASTNSPAVQERGWSDYERLVAARAKARPGETPPAYTRTKEAWFTAYAPGCIEYREALGPKGTYGKWLRSRPIAAQVEGSVFMHAGANPATQASLNAVNDTARQEIARFDRFVERLTNAKLIRPWFRFEDILAVAAAEVRWTSALLAAAKEKGEQPDLRGIDVEVVREASEILQIGSWSLLASDGPLWYRGYATADDAVLQPAAQELLTRWNAQRIVVGHTVNRDYRIRARFDRVFLIDTGMLAEVYKGMPSALELIDGRATAIYADGTRTQLSPAIP